MPQPTAREKQAYIDKIVELEKQFDRLDHQTIQRTIELLQDVRRNIADILAGGGASDFERGRLIQLRASINLVVADFQSKLGVTLNQSLTAAAQNGAAMVTEPLAAAGVTAAFNVVSPAQAIVAANFSAELVQDIGDDLRRKINAQLRLAVLGQEPPFTAMRRITKELGVRARDRRWGRLNRPEVVRGVAARAEAIVRTEMTRMHNLAHNGQQQQLAQSTPGLKKRWVASADSRTRKTHLAAHRRTMRKPIPVKQKFEVGNARLMFPGDPRGPAEETINCRCRIVTIHPEVGVIETPLDRGIDDEARKRA